MTACNIDFQKRYEPPKRPNIITESFVEMPASTEQIVLQGMRLDLNNIQMGTRTNKTTSIINDCVNSIFRFDVLNLPLALSFFSSVEHYFEIV